MGVEPTTSCMPCKRSSQLSYIPKKFVGKYTVKKSQKANIKLQTLKKPLSGVYLYHSKPNKPQL